MFSVTIQAESAQHLAALVDHLKTFDVPAFLKSEVHKAKPAAAAPSAVTTPAPAVSAPPKVEKPKVTKAPKQQPSKDAALSYDDDVKPATFLVAGIPGKGPNLITGVLSEFGVGHAKELKEEQWAEYIDKCKEVAEKNKEPANFA